MPSFLHRIWAWRDIGLESHLETKKEETRLELMQRSGDM